MARSREGKNISPGPCWLFKGRGLSQSRLPLQLGKQVLWEAVSWLPYQWMAKDFLRVMQGVGQSSCCFT